MAHDLFSIGVSWQEKAIRAVLVYLFLLIAIRVMGRRELGQLTAFDIIVLLTISNILQNAMIGNDNSLVGGMLGAAVLLSANLVLAFVVFRSKKVERVVEGAPSILASDGKLQRDSTRALLITEQDVLSAVRREGLESIDDVRMVILEPNGLISVIPKKK
jgi:uncharacterized membrane protein YcaP (DUF421 family)